MTKKLALQIAIEAITAQKKLYAFDANVAEQYGIDTPHALRCLKKRDEYNEALKVLGVMKQDSTFY